MTTTRAGACGLSARRHPLYALGRLVVIDYQPGR
jgi:hypothetical protein